MRETIDYGIDLGTTNSTIAKINGIDGEVFKNNEGFEFTPSAVWMDSKGRLKVGRRAKERLEDDPENAYSEFKLQMGSTNKYLFARSGMWMTPEQLSAEILKALKMDVKLQNGEDVESAVITVPAAFDLPQNKATNSAAELAGFNSCPLLQEPVAAATAYGFQTKEDNVYWLIYDFGGGTFDAAVIQVKDGLIEVVNHAGDNHLGGKLFDWSIVNELFVPAIKKEYKLQNFSRDNPIYRGAFAKLKSQAEQAKIRLSREESIEINIEYLCKNESGEGIEFNYDLRKSDFEKLAIPIIKRSINICNKVLAEKRLGFGDVEKVILVGGTSLIPSLRSMLKDSNEGLGIELESSIYPITVVARGAAIYAGSQRMPPPIIDPKKQIKNDEYYLDLDYSPSGADLEPPVGGKVTADKEKDYTGFTIEFINKSILPEWRSGKILVTEKGTFLTMLSTKEGKKNEFQIELLDSKGIKQKTIPQTIHYTPGIINKSIPLTHSIGVALAENEIEIYFEKGTPLTSDGVRKRKIHTNISEVRAGNKDDTMIIPFVEGENMQRADRNKLIGEIKLTGDKITRTIPAGSEVEITIEIDQSRLVRTKALIPILDEEIEEVLELGKIKISREDLITKFDKEIKRFEDVKNKSLNINSERVKEILEQIKSENMINEIENSLNTIEQDSDSLARAASRLLDLTNSLDKAEDALEWPWLLKDAEEAIEYARKVVYGQYGNIRDKGNFEKSEEDIRQAIRTNDLDILKKKIKNMDELYYSVLLRDPKFWVWRLDYMKIHINDMINISEANQLINRGEQAIIINDPEILKSITNELAKLLPPDKQPDPGDYGGTTTTN